MAENLPQLRRRHHALAARIGQIGFALSGSLVRRYTTCGKPGCHCQADPPPPPPPAPPTPPPPPPPPPPGPRPARTAPTTSSPAKSPARP